MRLKFGKKSPLPFIAALITVFSDKKYKHRKNIAVHMPAKILFFSRKSEQFFDYFVDGFGKIEICSFLKYLN